MGTVTSAKIATMRLIEYTRLMMTLILTLVLGQAILNTATPAIGQWFDESFRPTYAPSQILETNPDGTESWVKLDGFTIDSQRWQGKDLLLINGTFCKAEDRAVKDTELSFGTPDGLSEAGEIEFLHPRKLPRRVGCQAWDSWLIKGASKTKYKTWFIEMTHTPRHGLWDVRQILGPFKIPEQPPA